MSSREFPHPLSFENGERNRLAEAKKMVDQADRALRESQTVLRRARPDARAAAQRVAESQRSVTRLTALLGMLVIPFVTEIRPGRTTHRNNKTPSSTEMTVPAVPNKTQPDKYASQRVLAKQILERIAVVLETDEGATAEDEAFMAEEKKKIQDEVARIKQEEREEMGKSIAEHEASELLEKLKDPTISAKKLANDVEESLRAACPIDSDCSFRAANEEVQRRINAWKEDFSSDQNMMSRVKTIEDTLPVTVSRESTPEQQEYVQKLQTDLKELEEQLQRAQEHWGHNSEITHAVELQLEEKRRDLQIFL